ncbi:MAG: NYN domain-containing protein [Pyrinomonadaceae bacterium]
MRIETFIDGFNLYHAIDFTNIPPDPRRLRKYKWLDLYRLSECFVFGNDDLVGCNYFTAYATWDHAKMTRHQDYVKALVNQGVSVHEGRFKEKHHRCRNCQTRYVSREEKETDVHIGAKLIQHAVEDRFDLALLISGDTDLIPAIKVMKELRPEKKIGIILPFGRSSGDLRRQGNKPFNYKMKEKHLRDSQLPDPCPTLDGRKVSKPLNWV